MNREFTKGFMIFLPLLAVSTFSGCLNTTDPKLTFEPPPYVEEIPPKEEIKQFGNLGSLYGQGRDPLFADRKAMRVNDLLTIVINENTSTTSTAQKATNENGQLGLNGPNFVNNNANSENSRTTRILNNLNNVANIGVGMNSQNSFNGSGSQSRTETFNSTITARVIKILENGNYFIDGGREILIDGEKQIIRVSGVVRPYDIGRDNTINSRLISDAKIYYETEGDIKKSTQKNWGTKVIDAIWPF